jgi:hypothetical protein
LLAVSGLETLPPDQRAVLQLILVQGRGYADLAALLKLDRDAVRGRALAGVDALALPGRDAVEGDERARIADYLLGQQDDGERIVTFAALAESPAACRWAQALRERLAGVARGELPAVPAAPSSNGTATPSAALAAAPAEAPAGAGTATAVAQAPARRATPSAVPPPAAAPAGAHEPHEPSAPSRPSSRLGGAILLAGIAALAIVLAIVLIGGDDDPGDRGGTTTGAQTTQPASTQPARTTAGSGTAAGVLAQVNLNPTPSGGQALAVGIVQRARGRLVLAMQAERLPANRGREFYALWLQGSGGAKFLGFVPRQVGADGSFTVSTELPADAREYATVLVTGEGSNAVPTTPGTAILSGTLRLSA